MIAAFTQGEGIMKKWPARRIVFLVAGAIVGFFVGVLVFMALRWLADEDGRRVGGIIAWTLVLVGAYLGNNIYSKEPFGESDQQLKQPSAQVIEQFPNTENNAFFGSDEVKNYSFCGRCGEERATDDDLYCRVCGVQYV